MNEAEKYREALTQFIVASIPVQTEWVTVGDVDWDAKTMTAKDNDDLDYHDVLLGLCGIYQKPKENARALIGLIENKEGASFLLWADEYEEIHLLGDDNGGVPIAESIADKISTLEGKYNDLLNALNLIVVPLAPSGSYPLKSGLTTNSTITDTTTASDLESETVYHA